MSGPSDLVMFMAIVAMLVIAGTVVVCLDLRDERRTRAIEEAQRRPERIAELERKLGMGVEEIR